MAPRLYRNPFVADAPMVHKVSSEIIPHSPHTHISTANGGLCVDVLERTTYSDGSETVSVVKRTPLMDIELWAMRR